MVDKIQHKKIKRLHRIFSVLAILCVLLSACAVKMSIKNLIGASGIKTEQNKPANRAFVKSVVSSCELDNKFDQKLMTAKPIQNAMQIFPVILSGFLFFVFGLMLVKKTDEYSTSDQVDNLGSLPIFLQNRTLRI